MYLYLINFPVQRDGVIAEDFMKVKGAVIFHHYGAIIMENVREPIPLLTKEEYSKWQTNGGPRCNHQNLNDPQQPNYTQEDDSQNYDYQGVLHPFN